MDELTMAIGAWIAMSSLGLGATIGIALAELAGRCRVPEHQTGLTAAAHFHL